jgi:multicomponent Na+:H+ antiporter subunit G
MNTALDVISAVLMLAGSSLALIAAVGLFRMPDAYSRIHVATKPATLAVVCTVGAAVLQVPDIPSTTKLLLAVALQFWTAPVSSHMLGRAAHSSGLPPAEPWPLDELAEDEAAAEVEARQRPDGDGHPAGH